MKQTIFWLFLLLTPLAYSQQAQIDSFSIEFNKVTQDTLKAEIFAKIGIAAYYLDFKKARFYNDSLINFSKGRGQKYAALGYRIQGTLQLIDGDFNASEKSYLKSLKIFEKIQDIVYQGTLIANLATLYARQNQIAKADSMYLKAIDRGAYKRFKSSYYGTRAKNKENLCKRIREKITIALSLVSK